MSDWLWIKTPLQSSSKRFRIAVFSFFRIVQCMVTCSSNIVFRTTYKWTTNDHWWTGKQDKGSLKINKRCGTGASTNMESYVEV